MPSSSSARLALADGSIYHGQRFGAVGTRLGEVVFNTSMTGYQEILTDPSYAGQIVVMTAPHIGNTGTNGDDNEAARLFASGIVVRSLSPSVSNWRANNPLGDWLAAHDLPGITDVDTRALTRKLRTLGSLKGAICTDPIVSDESLVTMAREWRGLDGVDLVTTVTCAHAYQWQQSTPPDWMPTPTPAHRPYHVVAYDFGIKHNILRRLASYGCRVTVVPAQTTAEQVLELQPDGVLLSNGPGDPSALPYAVAAARSLLGRVPMLGICLGQQILGQAFGGRTYRLKFGHHGGNQPVSHRPSGRVEISAHNHNFAVDAASLPAQVEVTHSNLNDGCCEGFRSLEHAVLAVQYHPEAAPGPHDADSIFADFVSLMAHRCARPALIAS
jgi:carbamoyl-phosphate synthase small subunit